MKIAILVFAVLLLLLGLVWMGQGLGYIKGSVMTGQMIWFWVGIGCVIVSGILVGVRRGLR